MKKYLTYFILYFLLFGVISFFIFFPIDSIPEFIGRTIFFSLIAALTDMLLWDSLAKVLRKR